MKYTEKDIIAQYTSAVQDAVSALSKLSWAKGDMPALAGLNGWVFEKVIRKCLLLELKASGMNLQVREQVSLAGKARIDLLVGNAAIELKARGSFGATDSKYAQYRAMVEKRGWHYLYLSMQETHPPYRDATKSVFGPHNAFFLDTPGDWERFVKTISSLQKPGK